jgi:hypothetical protein
MNEQYVHAARLESDYRSMLQLVGSIITWQGTPPGNPTQRIYPSMYRVTYNILAPTIRGDSYQHVIEIDCSSQDYPRRIPFAKFLTPVVKHPHFFDYGGICLGGFPLEESLAELCIRLARFLQYDPTLINTNSLASSAFYDWYEKNLNRLPLDHSPLPQLDNTTSGFRVKRRSDAPSPAVDQPSSGITVRRRSPGNPQSW